MESVMSSENKGVCVRSYQPLYLLDPTQYQKA